MNLRTLQKHWDLFGAQDPLWAILTTPPRKDEGWEQGEFFATGVWEIGEALRYVESRVALAERRTALDFGCGVGRLTQALAKHFEAVHGVDISPVMIEHARRYNQFGERCRYAVNPNPDLSLFADGMFDFIYSNITLQHMPPRFSLGYVREFLRVLAPQGVLVFQTVSRPVRKEPAVLAGIRKFYYRVLWDVLRPGSPLMDMYPIPKDEMIGFLEGLHAGLVDVAADGSAGPDWEGYRYLVAGRDLAPLVKTPDQRSNM